MNENDLKHMLDEWSLYKLAMLYSRAMDQNVPEIIDSIFTEDAVIEAPSFTVRGRAAIRAMPASLKERFLSTSHAVHNQTVTISGDTAEGETNTLAHMVMRAPRGGEIVSMDAVRYFDKWVRQGGTWRFASRRIAFEFGELRAARASA